MVEETASPTDRVITSSPTAGETTQEPTAMPSGGPTMTITDSPTTAIPETMAPTTESPTSSPTGPPVTIGPTSIVPGLSAETVAKQGDFSTPQGQAFFFVEGYPGFEELPDWRKQQLFGMATFFNAFNGRRWPLSRRLNWLDADFHECDWASIQSQPCDLENKMEFLGLLNDDSLTGYVAPEVGLLTELEELSVDLCGLTGNATTVLPEELSALSNLRLFSVSRNALTGTMPSTISSLSSLQFLHLDDNQWTGTIPADWGQLTFLREINIGGNIGLTGTIPLEWAALTNLESLIIEGTSVSGAIPTELCNVPTLTVTADCGNIECC
ncbi:Leucine Rich Repeat [Seminavis robusta]|uniref:Leucine Rich Repeat n=1 Tax=Seminavis robusta TaxID=568900 RepID=A0A9N8EK67_9STRA|nr:Leucine Rich Repeat [Seminavis robusta]|eukprot:Sro1390_g268720.1 Leucine Rich Repeat (326) ;mRNA; r:29132-30191